MRLVGDDSRGYIPRLDVFEKGRGFQWTRKSKSRDLRPGPKHIPDTALVELGKRYVAGEGVILLARELGMSSA